jgi:hypothetical protein
MTGQALLLALAMNAAVAFCQTQRMLIESQNFTVPSGGTAQPRAMCLDASSHSPSPATRFASAPQNLGDISVTVPGGKQMSLQQAIDRHILEVRGTQGYSAVEFRNLLTSGEIKVAVRRNSVVVPDGAHATDELRGLPQLEAASAKFDQAGLWQARAVQQAAAPHVSPSPAADPSPPIQTPQQQTPQQLTPQQLAPQQQQRN